MLCDELQAGARAERIGAGSIGSRARAVKRLASIVALTVVAFLAAIAHFSHPPVGQGCVGDAPVAPGYSAAFEQPPSTVHGVQVMAVAVDGTPVSGVNVCVNTWMVGMSGMAMSQPARELGPGRYKVDLQFAMPGRWDANVLVVSGNQSAIQVPVQFDVAGDNS